MARSWVLLPWLHDFEKGSLRNGKDAIGASPVNKLLLPHFFHFMVFSRDSLTITFLAYFPKCSWFLPNEARHFPHLTSHCAVNKKEKYSGNLFCFFWEFCDSNPQSVNSDKRRSQIPDTLSTKRKLKLKCWSLVNSPYLTFERLTYVPLKAQSTQDAGCDAQRDTSKWGLFMWMGVSTLHTNNITGKTFKFEQALRLPSCVDWAQTLRWAVERCNVTLLITCRDLSLMKLFQLTCVCWKSKPFPVVGACHPMDLWVKAITQKLQLCRYLEAPDAVRNTAKN